MAADTAPPRTDDPSASSPPRATRVPRPRTSRPSRAPRLPRMPGPPEPRGDRSNRPLVIGLVLACLSLMVLDHVGAGDGHTPLDPARSVVGEVVGPAEAVASTALRPVTFLPDLLRTRTSLNDRIDTLEQQNADLEAEQHTSAIDKNRLAELEGLSSTAASLGYALVPARVIAMGPGQSFSSTVTIDAGSDAGLRADLTVVNDQGLVGRVLRVTRTTATVLLIVDADSTVGGRVGESMELGAVHGRGGLGDDGRLDLELVDQTVVPKRGQTVLTWGSDGAAPYAAGIPIGSITSVWSSARETAQRAEIEPFVDFSALDMVGVVVPSGTDSDRSVIEPDETWRSPDGDTGSGS